MSTCEVLPTAKMTDDHFMNPCILIRRRRPGLFWPGQKTMQVRPKGFESGESCIRSGFSCDPGWTRVGGPEFRVDNDGSALGKCKIYILPCAS